MRSCLNVESRDVDWRTGVRLGVVLWSGPSRAKVILDFEKSNGGQNMVKIKSVFIALVLLAGWTTTAGADSIPSTAGLGAHSDYTVFMQSGVPEGVRIAALRILWRTHPVITKVDELVDYGVGATTKEVTGSESTASAPVSGPALEPQASGTRNGQLPSIDSLDKDSDYTVFMHDGVPSTTQIQALRKLWKSDPAFAEVDDLTDYGYDNSSAG